MSDWFFRLGGWWIASCILAFLSGYRLGHWHGWVKTDPAVREWIRSKMAEKS